MTERSTGDRADDQTIELERPDAEPVEVDAGEWVHKGIAATIGVLVVLGLVWLGIQATNVLILVFVAILLASGLRPAVGLMRARLPIGLGTSILLGYGVFAVSIVVVSFLVVPTAVGQIDRFATELPASLERARAWGKTLQPDALSSTVTAVVDEISAEVHRATDSRNPRTSSPSA